MSGKAFAIVGHRGSGKSTKTKEMARMVNKDALLIYDPEQEHTDIYNKPFIPFDQFKLLADRVENCFIIYEEATIVIPNTSHDPEVKEMLVRARHRNNTLLFNFHSFRYLPTYVFDLLDYVIIFKTNDNPDYLNTRYGKNKRLNEAYQRINDAPYLYNKKANKYYSPHEVFAVHQIPGQ